MAGHSALPIGEIVAVGSELLLGGRPETNSLFLAESLTHYGIECRFKTVVGDVEKDIRLVLSQACLRADVVVITGGLGPTSDDVTRQAVARLTGKPLRRCVPAYERLQIRLADRGRRPSPFQLRQALIPAGAQVLMNPVGLAPGFSLTWKQCSLFVLPGVPSEARAMFATSVGPALHSLSYRSAGMDRRVIHLFGLSESDVDDQLRPLTAKAEHVRYGLTASPLGLTLSLTAWTGRPSRQGPRVLRKAEGELNGILEFVYRHFSQCIYAEGDQSMEQVVGAHLVNRGFMLALAESCTGGLVGHRLTQIPGSSRYVDRGVVSYSNRSKKELLGVPEGLVKKFGAVSAQVAVAMAQGIRRKSGTDIGLSVTGIAGPEGGTAVKPVGLVYVGLDVRRQHLTQRFQFYGDRESIKMRASQAALDVLRRWLEQEPGRMSPR